MRKVLAPVSARRRRLEGHVNNLHPLRSLASLRFRQMVTRQFHFALLATPLIIACGPDRSPTAPPPPVLYSLNGTWSANGPGLVDYRFTFTEGVVGGAIRGSWSGTKINCVGAGCSVSGLVVSSIRDGNWVQVWFYDAGNDFGGLIAGTLANDKTLTGGVALWWTGWLIGGDADYDVPVSLSR